MSHTFDEHLRNLKEVFTAIQNAGLKLNLKKCAFAKFEVKYLGFVLSEKGIAPNPEKVAAIKNFPVPADATSLRRFLGMVGYYRRFVAGFSEIAEPLHKLLQKSNSFQWNKNCQEAFEELQSCLSEAPIVCYPNFDKDFIVYTDASNVGVGGILAQKQDDGSESVIAYASRALHGSERNWTTTEKEAYAIVWALEHFTAYVYGKKVIVYTDHRALQWLRDIKSPSGKLARWLLKLEEFDYEVVHKPGNLMQHVDALSRAPVLAIQVSTWSTSELLKLQEDDVDLSVVKSWITDGCRPDEKPVEGSDELKTLYSVFPVLSIRDGLLCRKWKDETETEKHQIVLPKAIRDKILEEVHIQVGHFGISKTFDMLQQRFYWPGFYKSVVQFCKSCETCARNKTMPRPRWPLKPIEIIPIPFYMVGVDIIGPLKTTRFRNRYILTVIDYYTKYAEAIALENQEAETVVRALESIFSRHGMPAVLLSDQGTNFQSHLFTSMCRLFNIEKRRTTPYHPQTDGLCERFNGTLKSLLRMRVNPGRDDWDEQLPFALLAYRVTKQTSTGVTPFEMLYRRGARLPVNIETPDIKPKPVQGAAKYLADLQRRQDTLRTVVADKLKAVQQKQKERYDGKFNSARSNTYRLGDHVMLRDNTSRGLSEKYKGPYEVIKANGANYLIRLLGTNKEKYVHYNRLKPFQMSLEAGNDILKDGEGDVSQLEDSDTDDETFEFMIPTIIEPDLRQAEELEEPEIQFVADAEEEILQRDPLLRRGTRVRRPPDRYGVSVTDF
eukprot:gene5342-6012_t